EEYGQKLLRREAAMTGLDIVFLDHNDSNEDIFIEIEHYTDPRAPGWKPCNTFADVGAQGQPRAHVVMDPLGVIRSMRRDTAGFYGCFNRETMRALGFSY